MKADKESAAPLPRHSLFNSIWRGVGEEWGGLEEGMRGCTIVGPCSVLAEWVGRR